MGRKGSGKSALFTQLPRLIDDAGYDNAKVALLTPDQYAWSKLQEYQEQGLQPEHAHTNAWKFTIAIEAAGILAQVPDSELSSEEAQDAKNRLNQFIRQNFGESEPTIFSTATRLIKGIKSFNLSAFGFGAGLERESQEQPITPLVIDSLIEQVSIVCAEVCLVIAFDKLDDAWDGSENSQNLLIGLLKAAKEINDRFVADKRSEGFTVFVFLRTDIYEGLRFDDKDKHRASEQHIEWNSELLKRMLRQRLPENVEVDNLFEKGDMRGGITPFNYIVKRTFLRPREIIQFIQECIAKAGMDAKEISKEKVREAEEKYSSWKIEDLKQEYRRVEPDFEYLLEGLRQGEHRYDSIEEFKDYIDGVAPEVVQKMGLRRALELLFDASVIGVRLGDSGSPKFRCEDSDVVLPANGAVYVHQSVFRGLNIRERRSSS